MTAMRDLIIVLPGITGSVLERDGREVWAPSGQAFWEAGRTLFGSVRDLALDGVDDPGKDNPDLDLGDGVRATRLIEDVHIVPGVHKIDGYTDLRRRLVEDFEVVRGELDSNRPANYFEFAYDWRRDNRVTAHRLQRFIAERLPRWRVHSGADDAKVILIGHSMGGLISRYYLEALSGWQQCKLLVTFGTPYRGSLDAIDNLVNGVRQFGLRIGPLSDVLRTLPSVYQLLPRYPVVDVEGEWRRVTETNALPDLSQAKATKGVAFLKEVEAARKQNEQEARYHTDGYKIVPVVGTHQSTWQSARLRDGRLTMHEVSPPVVGEGLATGDGTVPRVSAVPLELSGDFRESFMAEKHASLQSNRALLHELSMHLESSQADLEDVFDIQFQSAAFEGALSLTVDDIYPAGEPIAIEVELFDADRESDLVVRVNGLDQRTVRVEPEQGRQVVELPPLAAGTHRVELASTEVAASPVHDVFAVAAREAA